MSSPLVIPHVIAPVSPQLLARHSLELVAAAVTIGDVWGKMTAAVGRRARGPFPPSDDPDLRRARFVAGLAAQCAVAASGVVIVGKVLKLSIPLFVNSEHDRMAGLIARVSMGGFLISMAVSARLD